MYDLIIIGSGPAGLSAAIYGIRAGLNLIVIEKDYEGTGQIALSSRVDNYLGLPGMDGYSMGEQFRQHAVDFGVNFLETEVASITSAVKENSSIFVITAADGQTLEAQAVIYATGATHRKLGAPGEEKFDTRGVSYCATCDGAFYRNKKTAVIGGGDTALDDALYLSGICEKVYLIHRRDTFRAADITVQKVKEKENIELILNSTVAEILGDTKVNSLRINTKPNNTSADAEGLFTESVIEVDGVFVAAGSVPSTSIVPSEVNLDPSGYIIADESCVTSLPGFFAAGDVRTKSLRQVITAVSDGANAITSVSHYLTK